MPYNKKDEPIKRMWYICSNGHVTPRDLQDRSPPTYDSLSLQFIVTLVLLHKLSFGLTSKWKESVLDSVSPKKGINISKRR
jgi:hypothetical protein